MARLFITVTLFAISLMGPVVETFSKERHDSPKLTLSELSVGSSWETEVSESGHLSGSACRRLVLAPPWMRRQLVHELGHLRLSAGEAVRGHGLSVHDWPNGLTQGTRLQV